MFSLILLRLFIQIIHGRSFFFHRLLRHFLLIRPLPGCSLPGILLYALRCSDRLGRLWCSDRPGGLGCHSMIGFLPVFRYISVCSPMILITICLTILFICHPYDKKNNDKRNKNSKHIPSPYETLLYLIINSSTLITSPILPVLTSSSACTQSSTAFRSTERLKCAA